MSQKIRSGCVVVDLGQRVEAVLGQQHVVAALLQEDLGAAPDGVAVVDDQHLDACCGFIAHRESPLCTRSSGCRLSPRSGPPVCQAAPADAVRSGPFRNLPCGRHTPGRSSSWAPASQARAGGDAVIGVARGFVVDPATDQAHPGPIGVASLLTLFFTKLTTMRKDCSHAEMHKNAMVFRFTYATIPHVCLEVPGDPGSLRSLHLTEAFP